MKDIIEQSLQKVENLIQGMEFNYIAPKPDPTVIELPVISSPSSTMLVRAFETVKNVLGENFFDIELENNIICVREKGTSAEFNYTPVLASLIEFMDKKQMNIHPLPEIKIKRDLEEGGSFFGRTAYYNPQEKEVVLYVHGRHPKDVVRSFCHEMIHHIQNLENRLGNISTTNTTEDDHLLNLEKEAYLDGNLTFRMWEDTIKVN